MSNTGDDTRARLLEAAGEVFAENGFRASTVREICSRAGANLAAVNYHFGDKERLYIEAVKHAHCSGAAEATTDWPADMTAEVKLREYIHLMLSQLLDPNRPAWHARLMAREMVEPSATCLAVVEPHIRENYELLCGILAELLPPDTGLEQLHLVAFSIVGQCVHFKVHRPIAKFLVGEEELRGYDVERLTDHISRFALAALGRAEPAPGGTTTSSTDLQP